VVLSVIKSTREIDALFSEGERSSHAHILALARHTPEGRGPEGRVVFVAGKRLGGAVLRNRSKRVLRAAVHRSGASWDGYDVALIARPSTATASEEILDRALRSVLKKAGLSDD